MANLKDLLVNGNARVVGNLYANVTGSLNGNANTATSASKLTTTTAGSTTTPVYFEDGIPKSCSLSIDGSLLAEDTKRILLYNTTATTASNKGPANINNCSKENLVAVLSLDSGDSVEVYNNDKNGRATVVRNKINLNYLFQPAEHSHSINDLKGGSGSVWGTSDGGTGFSSYTKGAILYAGADGNLSKLTAGTNGQVLKLKDGMPSWGTDNNDNTVTTVSYTTDVSNITLDTTGKTGTVVFGSAAKMVAETSIGAPGDDEHVPTSKAVVNYVSGLNCVEFSNNFTKKNKFSAASTVTSTSAGSDATVYISAGGLVAESGIRGAKVYNAVWNDLVDCIPIDNKCRPEYGYCYCFDGDRYYKSKTYMEQGIIGIHSDTAGFEMGHKKDTNELHCAVSGFCLAYVDKEYPVGTPLTCTENGYLTEIKLEDKLYFPERIIATFWKNESEEYWGSESEKVKVNNRKWVKIK